jgi:hypothetical protein
VVSYVDPDAGNVVAYVAHFDHIRIWTLQQNRIWYLTWC